MDIQINFINNSNDTNNSQVVVFQKNVALGVGEVHVAWRVIRCVQGGNHPFVVSAEPQINISDSWGNYTPQKPALAGHQFRAEKSASGDTLVDTGERMASGEVHLLNGLSVGAINANIYKGGKLLATKTGIAPQQRAAFRFEPTIWVGQTDQTVEGQIMDETALADVDNELSLLGIASADLVMTGGGPGPNSTAFKFSLENVVMA